jgi:arabinoxylan arabinofuranohydrolase
VIYRKEQDPRNQNIPTDTPAAKPGFCAKQDWTEKDLNAPGIHAMWAPDVVKGLDGRYYLYYCMDYLPEIGVAVCDTPAGSYEYLGLVRHADETVLGQKKVI